MSVRMSSSWSEGEMMFLDNGAAPSIIRKVALVRARPLFKISETSDNVMPPKIVI